MCVWGRFFAQKRGKTCVLTRQDVRFASFSQNRDNSRYLPKLRKRVRSPNKNGENGEKKATAAACLAVAAGSTFNAKNFDFERSPSTPQRARQRLRRHASRLRTRQECAPTARCPRGGSLCGNRDSLREHRARKHGSARRSAPSRRRAR